MEEYTIVHHIVDNETPNDDIDEVLEDVKNYIRLNEDIISKRKTGDLVDKRCLLAHILRKNTDLPLYKIGKILGDRDHSTIMNALDQHESRYKIRDESYIRHNRRLIKKYKNLI